MQPKLSLPIDTVLEPLRRALIDRRAAVLVAPPGAGKTTRVPLALLGQPWLAGKKIIMLEPRRLAARGAAARMATTLSEPLGKTIGLRARLSSKVGPETRIEVVTEGVFTRMILDDPSLDGIGAVLFDEFHERSLDADLGLALALDSQSGLREDLRLVIMSATLDGARIAEFLGDAPVIESKGRAFPIETRHIPRNPAARIEDRTADAVIRALRADPGSILVFLPGQGEIRRVRERLTERLDDPAVVIAPLFGAMEMAAQDQAIAPAPSGTRKVVLATSIAETSLTIEGVRIVIDCGMTRVPRFEPDAGITRLETVRVSRAAADQRRGRAGRTETGICYRLWDEPETSSLLPFAAPEISSADLSGLVLDCAEWGVSDPARLTWLNPPPQPSLERARTDLENLGALDGNGRLTETGKRIRTLPLPPRLASMILHAAAQDTAAKAAEIAAILAERGLGGRSTDLEERLDEFRRDKSRRARDMRRLAQGWARDAQSMSPNDPSSNANDRTPSTAALLALAYPERIAKARGTSGQFLLANGRGANLDTESPLARSPYIVVAEMQGSAAATRILLGARTDATEVETFSSDRIHVRDELTFDLESLALRSRRIRRLCAIELESAPRRVEPGPIAARALADGVAIIGIDRLPWTKAQSQLRQRTAFLKESGDADMPDLTDAHLRESIQEWLSPFLTGKTRYAEITSDDLGQALDALLPWALKRRLDENAPAQFHAPSGNRHAIDYENATAPALHIRVQELFGHATHPAIAGGKIPLTLHLLSPARRPIQITRDLPGFWTGSWTSVKAEMKGRYPRHPWPDDPANSKPTARAKPRGT
jgi:ATP-dependent RNA helicase HrpB